MRRLRHCVWPRPRGGGGAEVAIPGADEHRNVCGVLDCTCRELYPSGMLRRSSGREAPERRLTAADRRIYYPFSRRHQT